MAGRVRQVRAGLRRSRLSSRPLICYEYSSEYLAKLFDYGRLPDRKAQSVHTATFARIRALNHLALLVADDLVQSVFFDRAVRVLFAADLVPFDHQARCIGQNLCIARSASRFVLDRIADGIRC